MQKSSIRRDISAFRDPGTNVAFIENPTTLRFSLIRDGTPESYIINKATGTVASVAGDPKYSSVASFLASPRIVDLPAFAATQKRLLISRLNEDNLPAVGLFTDYRGQKFDSLSEQALDAFRHPKMSVHPHCIIIDGAAGVGKTTFIERECLARVHDLDRPPLLHVTSRGRRLTNLRDALAGTITSFRARFVPEEIPVLVRHGVLQIALDGFDEFVDPSGYQDAWSTLRDFVRECAGGLPIILAGRDTFFDAEKFRRQLEQVSTDVAISQYRLTEVTPSIAVDWLRNSGWPKSAIESDTTRQLLLPNSYMLRPFFLSQIRDMKGWDKVVATGLSPQSFLIDRMVEREAKLLSAALATENANIEATLHALFEAIAADMAEREAESIPLHYLTFLAEYEFEGKLPKKYMNRLKFALPSLAFIEKAESPEELRFPHTEIQNRFLARAIVRAAMSQANASYISRSALAMDKVEAFSERMLEVPRTDIRKLVLALLDQLRSGIRSPIYAQNVAALVLAACSAGQSMPALNGVAGLSVLDVRILQTAGRARIKDVDIARLDIRGADVSDVMFENCSVGELIVDGSSLVGVMPPRVDVIRLEDNSDTKWIRAGELKDRWISDHTSAAEVQEESSILRFFERLCRRFIGQTYIRDVPSDPGSYLIRTAEGKFILKVLKIHNRLRVTFRQAGGQNAPFYSLDRPDELLAASQRRDNEHPVVRDLLGGNVKQ